MTRRSSNRVLIIPVFRGGHYFRECLIGLAPHLGKFEVVVISLNGSAASVAEDKKAVELILGKLGSFHLIETGTELSAVEHNHYILKFCRDLGAAPEDLVLNLFHDDVLKENFHFPGSEAGTVQAGDWEDYDSTNVLTAINQDRVSSMEWIENYGILRAFTNGSGMVATFETWMDVSEKMRRWKTGVRYEYLALTHRNTEQISRSSTPLLRLRQHEGQQGANIDLSSYARGELMFVSWLFEQGRVNSFRSWFLVVFLIMALSKNLLVLGLKSAFRTHTEKRHP